LEQLNLMGQGRWQHGGEGIKGAVKDATERQFSTKSGRGAVRAGLVFSLAMSSRTSLRSVFSSWSALIALLSLGVLGGALSGCSRPTAYVIEGDTMVYTLTNLHPDERRGLAYSLNYQQDGLIPVCTQVNIDSVNQQELRFTVSGTGRQYRYLFTRHLRDAIDMHMSRYFGPNCPDLTALSEADRVGIQQGQVFQGMSKQGVILAIGYPPEHQTPSLEADQWSYWRNSHSRFQVYFVGGLVSGIQQ
jgi:hypothetical protein